MKNKKALVLLILSITLVIGFSFASWIITLTQTNNNVIGSKCFNLTLSETNPINLTSAYPLTDTEGASLTPFDFTITNTCSSYASYQVNLEVLNTTTLASTEVKVMLDNGTPALLSTKTTTTLTLQNASSAYIIKTGFLDPNDSVTYHLRLWVKEDSTTEASANKTFSSKITITAGYKDDVTDMERCEAEYGEGAAVCNIIAEADTTNNKCLHTDQNGMITDYSTTMSDADTPIICTMEDDYGTSYYLRGLHTNNNVKFANSCWKIIRATGTGGIKMIYNGDVDGSGTCTTISGNHNGFTGQELSLSGNKLYGTSYTKEGSTYTLTDTSTMNWPNEEDNIIGKYTCNSTSNTCSTLYAVTGKYSSSNAYVVKLDQSTNYAQIGTSAFNYYDNNEEETSSPALSGYMFNDVYRYSSKKMIENGAMLLSSNQANTSNYYYGDTITYSGGYYYITNQNNSNVVQLDWANNYQNNLVGKYTCKGTSKYNNTTIRCTTAYKVLDTTTKTNYMLSEYLTGGRLSIGNINLASSYTYDGTNYTLISPASISAMDWYNGYSNYTNYYYCGDWNQTTCSDLRKITSASQTSFGTTYELSHKYYYGSSFTYNGNNTRPYTLTDTIQFWDITDSTNITSLNTHHYTCFYSADNTCDELYFIYYLDGITLYYIKLNGNETIDDALDKMLSSDSTTAKNSHIKGVIDYWYKENILGTEYERYLEDTVFCNDRMPSKIGGWSETGVLNPYLEMDKHMQFNAYNNKYYLKCPQKRDAFTVNDAINGNGVLRYPIGLLTVVESVMIGNYSSLSIGESYWELTPGIVWHGTVGERIDSFIVNQGGNYDLQSMLYNLRGVRPTISLKPGTKFVAGGDGTGANPYVVDMTS